MTDYDALRVTETGESIRFEVHAKPRAKKSRIGGVRDAALEVSVAAPPVDGAANDALVRLLAETLGVARRDVTLVRGDGARAKLFEIRGLTAQVARQRLDAAAETTR